MSLYTVTAGVMDFPQFVRSRPGLLFKLLMFRDSKVRH